MALRGEGLTEGAGPSTPMNVVYVLHPNCAVEDI